MTLLSPLKITSDGQDTHGYYLLNYWCRNNVADSWRRPRLCGADFGEHSLASAAVANRLAAPSRDDCKSSVGDPKCRLAGSTITAQSLCCPAGCLTAGCGIHKRRFGPSITEGQANILATTNSSGEALSCGWTNDGPLGRNFLLRCGNHYHKRNCSERETRMRSHPTSGRKAILSIPPKWNGAVAGRAHRPPGACVSSIL